MSDDKYVTEKESKPPKDANANVKHKTEDTDTNRRVTPKIENNTKMYLIICVIGVTLGIVVEIINLQYRNNINTDRPKYWVYLNSNRDSLLKHLHVVLERVGYEKTTNQTPWNLLWAHGYPFNVLEKELNSLKPHQRVNHFPGIGFLTNKVNLATTESKYIPKAFRLPKNKADFLDYASENKNAMFVEKENTHRGVIVKNITDMDEQGDKFVQEYVANPFLVDGYKFDIGVYVVLTSVDPLKLYYYAGDVLFRYCPDKYYPFDPHNLKKYVIADDYRPTWKVPALEDAFSELGFGMKEAFDIYARSKGKDPAQMWIEVQNAIREIFLKKEHHIVEALKKYPFKENFFELLRVDLMVDEDLRVYLLEVNMSPNLVSPNPPNQLLYEQVVYNTISVAGLSRPLYNHPSHATTEECGHTSTNIQYDICIEKKAGSAMLSADKNIAVWGDECVSSCENNCGGVCALCQPCLTPKIRNNLLLAYREHVHRGEFRRIFPPPMKQYAPLEGLKELTPQNRLMYMWYQGKCNQDASWCS